MTGSSMVPQKVRSLWAKSGVATFPAFLCQSSNSVSQGLQPNSADTSEAPTTDERKASSPSPARMGDIAFISSSNLKCDEHAHQERAGEQHHHAKRRDIHRRFRHIVAVDFLTHRSEEHTSELQSLMRT